MSKKIEIGEGYESSGEEEIISFLDKFRLGDSVKFNRESDKVVFYKEAPSDGNGKKGNKNRSKKTPLRLERKSEILEEEGWIFVSYDLKADYVFIGKKSKNGAMVRSVKLTVKTFIENQK
ncbi:MAG: hypothetical protein UR31_C0031G0004 [Parcubacteria group bacterium GW2011_GWA2_33_14]|nr:MAG: hypothetical protein UR31_C0031G0004 [Parcubacteria group bacterium GW2011_GWA2_33_14]OGZ70791.1 MAG: hypothetical protein A2980_02050 [Candidatus Staskawiczbacteria bacterium RIFCSPLOWO2_01_FULL_33_13]